MNLPFSHWLLSKRFNPLQILVIVFLTFCIFFTIKPSPAEDSTAENFLPIPQEAYISTDTTFVMESATLSNPIINKMEGEGECRGPGNIEIKFNLYFIINISGKKIPFTQEIKGFDCDQGNRGGHRTRDIFELLQKEIPQNLRVSGVLNGKDFTHKCIFIAEKNIRNLHGSPLFEPSVLIWRH